MKTLASKVLEVINDNSMNNNAKVEYIKEICEKDIFNENRDKLCTKTEKKRLSTIEKFLDKATYKEVCKYILLENGKAIYTDCHVEAIIPEKFIDNIDKKYILPNGQKYLPYKKVIPTLSGDIATCKITYGELMAFAKVAKAAKKGLRGSDRDLKDDISLAYSDGLYRDYNVNYLIHCCNVAGVDEMTLKAPAGLKNVFIPATIETENGCKFIVAGCRGEHTKTGKKVA
ncbi:hypothetical protein SELR_pSRC300500 (plasmid) [Selenomonas ruminantium subsp. lactilytica TAM6421]|uniref:Uncharacterized protein n=1 Tax=Selenomonas ruminantium subsp. lactilytica (strain NBRC 103574 / TAM6421) TaxID=927704 RepID=I0GWI6_SELRL|nr:hypothetical protein [Selenomonas ruminantium]BAL85123.1 hypothetical protein SELR_pSRC300500 [Selenomonas ruminantium subsp. lactilytica TAM6421]